jgi:hypothetical protein
MQRSGQEQRLDARSWSEQGREDLAVLREPKLLGGEGREAQELREQVDQLRGQRKELPAPHLDRAAAIQQVESEGAKAIAEVEQRARKEISLIDRAIAEVKEKYEQAKQYVRETFEGLRAQNTPAQTVAEPPPKTESFMEKFRREQAEKIEARRQEREQSNPTHKPRHTQ